MPPAPTTIGSKLSSLLATLRRPTTLPSVTRPGPGPWKGILINKLPAADAQVPGGPGSPPPPGRRSGWLHACGPRQELDSPRRTPSPARLGCSWRAPVGPRRWSVGVGRFRGDAPGDFSAGLRQGAQAGALPPPGGTAATREAAATPART